MPTHNTSPSPQQALPRRQRATLREAASSTTALLMALIAAALLLPAPVAAATSVCTYGCLSFFTITPADGSVYCCVAAPGNDTSFSPTYNTCWDLNGPYSDANCTVLAVYPPFPPPSLPPAPPPPPVVGDCGTLGCTFEFKIGNQTYHCCTGTTGTATIYNECPSSDPNCNGGYPLPLNITCVGGPKAGVGPWTDPLCGASLPPSPPPYPPPSPPSPPPRPPPTNGATLATPAGSAATRFWSAAVATLSMLLVAGAF